MALQSPPSAPPREVKYIDEVGPEPASLAEAESLPHAEAWEPAMKGEYEGLDDSGTLGDKCNT